MWYFGLNGFKVYVQRASDTKTLDKNSATTGMKQGHALEIRGRASFNPLEAKASPLDSA
jgi:hypothetical protein